jgi:hypothetical protein
MRTLVTFKSSAFNTSEPKDYFINDGCFGDDIAKWLIRELQKLGFQPIDEPGQEDFCWYFTFRVGNTEHAFLIGFRPGDANTDGIWIGWLERKRSFIGSVLGGRKRGTHPAAAHAIHVILSASPQIQDVRWHVQATFERDHEESGSPEP